MQTRPRAVARFRKTQLGRVCHCEAYAQKAPKRQLTGQVRSPAVRRMGEGAVLSGTGRCHPFFFTGIPRGVANSQAHNCAASAVPAGLNKINRKYSKQ